MEAKVNRENITKHLIEKELEMVGKKIIDTLDEEDWFYTNTMTSIQYEEFKKYSINLIKKIFKCNTKRAADTYEWFYRSFGLRVKN